MTGLRLLEGYRKGTPSQAPPAMGWRKMLALAWRTWPYTQPMLKHLIALLALTFSGGLVGLVTASVGVDLFMNKVLVGDKLQPIQAIVLFVGEEYVTIDPEAQGPEAQDKDAAAVDREPELTPEQRTTVRNRLLLWGILGGVLGTPIGLAIWYYSTWIWQSINQNLRVAMFQRASVLSLRFHYESRVGDAIFRVYQDSAMIVNLLQSGIITPAATLYGIAFGLAIVMAFDPVFALMVVAVSVPIGWLIVVTTPRIRRRALANRAANSDLTSRIQEVFAAIKVIKANRAEASIFERFDEDSTSALNAAYFLRLDMVLITLAVALLGTGLVIAAEYLMANWVVETRDTFLGAIAVSLIGFAIWNYGGFLVARGRVEGLARSARGVLGQWMRMQAMFIALERAFHLLDVDPEIEDPVNPVPFPVPIQSVSWHAVAFGYQAGKPVLHEIDLDARAGTVTAIVGATGAGKSTLMSLLLRLYDPTSGHVTVNGVDLRAMSTDDIRAHAAIALQKNVLFADTVANNIGFGVADVKREAIEEAAKVACADEFIREMPNGYDTELGERGGKLSAGQRQRLSIARAIVRDAPVLILDEPTASLDARTEHRVLANLAEWGRGRVIFLITHRLSTIRNADQIALIEDGRIVAHGNHDALMANNGRYRTFVGAELGVAAAGADR